MSQISLINQLTNCNVIIWDFGDTLAYLDLPWERFFVLAPAQIAQIQAQYLPQNLKQLHQLIDKQYPNLRSTFLQYRSWFETQLISPVRLNPTAINWLTRLPQTLHYIWSNNMLSTIESVLTDFDLLTQFKFIAATDNMHQLKPDPAGFEIIQQQFQFPTTSCLMVGNPPIDQIAAKQAGIAFLDVDNLPNLEPCIK